MRKIYSILLFLFFCLSQALASTSPNTPAECLALMQKAVNDGNAQEFEKYCDMDAILEEGLGVFLKQAQDPTASSQFPPMVTLFLTQLTGNKGQAIRNLLLTETKSFILNCIRSGAFAGKRLPYGKQQGLLAPMFANASLGKKELVQIGESEKTATGWNCAFTIHDGDNDENYYVVGKFRNENGICRLIGIENFDQLFEQIQQESLDD